MIRLVKNLINLSLLNMENEKNLSKQINDKREGESAFETLLHIFLSPLMKINSFLRMLLNDLY